MATIKIQDGKIYFEDVEIFIAQEKKDSIYVALCPSLDLSAYGETIEQSRAELISIINDQVEWMQQQGTLEDDLRQHGWEICHDEVSQSTEVMKQKSKSSKLKSIIHLIDKSYTMCKEPPYSGTLQPAGLF